MDFLVVHKTKKSLNEKFDATKFCEHGVKLGLVCFECDKVDLDEA